ncbi:hypothetical protein [Nocardiopsis sp. CC223A]|uniref:hypothetical protein n=1 Tax=Nocardiopsis sp. CC223A TaxID=3044051 RepID=UPI00278BE82A|nr:hypothetical protein [Nocardiopsis sp. CC223A]
MKHIAGITLMTIAAGAALGLTAAPASAGGHDGYPGYDHVHSILLQGHHDGYPGYDDGDHGDRGHGYY